MDTSQRVDPEPFTVLVGVAGILGGVASVAAAYKAVARDSPVVNRRAALKILDQAADELRHLTADLITIQEILAEADISADRRFRLETAAFLSRRQFARYKQTTDQLFGRLHKLLKATNKLDPLLPRLAEIRVNVAAREIEEVRGRLDRVIRDRDISVDDALNDLSRVVGQVQELIDGLRADLHG